MQLIDRISEKLEKKSMSVLTMSKETGIPAYRIYKWIDGKGKPKSDDSIKLEKWLSGNLDILPNEAANVSNPNDPAYMAGQLSLFERLITKLEKENEAIQADKEKLLKTLDKAQDAIIKALEPIKEYTGKILANSETIQADLAQVARMVRADDLTTMDSLDRLEGREAGTASTEASIVERAFAEEDQDTDTNTTRDTGDNSGKVKQKGKA